MVTSILLSFLPLKMKYMSSYNAKSHIQIKLMSFTMQENEQKITLCF